MKKFCIVLILILSFSVLGGILLNPNKKEILTCNDTSDFLRIHIRANSNDNFDQKIKYKIKDEFVNYLTPLVADCKTKEQSISLICDNKMKLEKIADDILKSSGLSYTSNIKICKEHFPTRTYDNYTLVSGVYDSIIVELGKAVGNNWWCVIYPPLCFTNFSGNSQNIVYKSKILEIINKFFN